MQQGVWICPLEKEAFQWCPLKPFFSSNTQVKKHFLKVIQWWLKAEDVFMVQVVKCICSLFLELSGNCVVVIYWSASTAAG